MERSRGHWGPWRKTGSTKLVALEVARKSSAGIFGYKTDRIKYTRPRTKWEGDQQDPMVSAIFTVERGNPIVIAA